MDFLDVVIFFCTLRHIGLFHILSNYIIQFEKLLKLLFRDQSIEHNNESLKVKWSDNSFLSQLS